MASAEHSAYCFEVLSASLESRKPMSLKQVEASWRQFKQACSDRTDEEVVGEDEEDVSESLDTQKSHLRRFNDNELETEERLHSGRTSQYLALSPSTRSSSSSTPSSASTASLRAGSSQPSASSSRSSLFSLGHRLGSRLAPAKQHHSEFPLFVTWSILGRSGGKHLRGCIGTFEEQELDHGLRSYALTSALNDSRFPPITLREISDLECGVTLLTDFEAASDPMDWELGKHGLRIAFVHRSRRYGATYLPDVPKEQGWTKLETMISLMRKAGWNGRKEEWEKVGDLTVTRYQGSAASIKYGEWRAWKSWLEEQDSRLEASS